MFELTKRRVWMGLLGALFVLIMSGCSSLFGGSSDSSSGDGGTGGADAEDIVFHSDRDGDYEIYAMNPDGSDSVKLTDNSAADAYPGKSPDGSKIAFASNRRGNYEIYVMDADGSDVERLTSSSTGGDFAPRWAPDGSRILYHSGQQELDDYDIYVINADGSGKTRLTDRNSVDAFGSWKPDGSEIAFHSTRDGNFEIYTMDPDGNNQTNVTNSPREQSGPSWSPDGSQIAFASTPADGQPNAIHKMDTGGANATTVRSVADDIFPDWSPDGSRMVFQASNEIYVMDADGSNLQRLTNNGAVDGVPRW